MLEKTYNPEKIEPEIYKQWQDAECFKAGVNAKQGQDSFCIVIPPPNVTGNLHIGHALDNTLQDILIRFERMRGKNVLWQPGLDHAGIATQMVVERQMAEEGLPGRKDMERGEFIEKVWQWKAESGGAIIGQLKRLGASCDWSRERFTMDEGLSKAVLQVFVQLYKEGLIYKGTRLVNWDPHFQSAISDLEVEQKEVQGHMWHFKYPLAGGETYEYIEKDEDGNITLQEERDYISIATTRPETMLGDGAVAVHPDDERYKPIIGKLCEIPVGPKEHRRLIPIITDEYPDPGFGSGAVKITGAHDFNDYDVAMRNNIPLYTLMDTKAAMRIDGLSYSESAQIAKQITEGEEVADISPINLVPEELRGLDRYEARKRVIDAINAEGLSVLESVQITDDEGNEQTIERPYVENKIIMQPHSDRSKVVVEPFLTEQWYADAATLAKPAIEVVKNNQTQFSPKSWENTYFGWMDNIQPWCISRQLWWGHQIPAWYAPDGQVFVALSEQDAKEEALAHYGKETPLTRDEDVLDTWFSSALWPFSTLGWPDQTQELSTYYPTNVLVTGHDIIFFWVARMMMFGMHIMKEIPFNTVCIHGLVLDSKGVKMSKTKGNVVNPLEKIDEVGADALRMTLAAFAAAGRNIRFSDERLMGYRNFATKLWNAVRFCEMNDCFGHSPDLVTLTPSQPINQWIIANLDVTISDVTENLESLRFDQAASSIYKFVWHQFCDWWVELAKPVFNGEDDVAAQEARQTADYVIAHILKLLHPFMPFMTEHLWARTLGEGQTRDQLLMVSDWPTTVMSTDMQLGHNEIEWLTGLITKIRSTRMEMNIPAGSKVPLVVISNDGNMQAQFATHEMYLKKLARLESITFSEQAPENAAQIIHSNTVAAIPLEGVIDLEAERKRLAQDKEKLSKELMGIEKKLNNEQFLSKAPENVVNTQRERREEIMAKCKKIELALSHL